MGLLYKRKASVTVGSFKAEDFHVRFEASKDSTTNPNTLELVIWNLAESSRAKLNQQRVPVTLQAGYESGIDLIFSGDSRTVDHIRNGPDWETRIRCGDGEKPYSESWTFKTFPPGADLKTVVRALANDLGVNAKDALGALGGLPTACGAFRQGCSSNGRTPRELDRVLRAANLEWWVTDGNLVIRQPGKAISESAVRLTPDTGLIGSPEHGAKSMKPWELNYIKVKCLLNGSIRPGRVINLESQHMKGQFIAVKVSHRGDMSSDEWQTEVHMNPFSG